MSCLLALLAIGRPCQSLDLEFHQPLGGEADHLAQEIGVRTLFQKRAKVHHLVGHREFLGCVCDSQPEPYRRTADGRRKLRDSGFAPPGPNPTCPWCGSPDTRLENPFGPTRCRAIFWCNRCRQPFEQFKAV